MIDQTMPGAKSHIATLLLAIFLGGLGLHRFYLGRIGTGLLRILCLPIAFFPVVGVLFLVVIHLVDIMLVATKSLRPSDGAAYA